MGKYIPTEITLHKVQAILEIAYEDGHRFKLPCEYLRVYSPSAEVRGHGPGEEKLQVGKEDVTIEKIEQVGTYAIKPSFDDGHDSGIFTWEYLHELGVNYVNYWQDYLDKMKAAGHAHSQLS